MVFLKKGASFKRFSTWYSRLNDRPVGKLHSIKNPIVKILLHTFWSVALNEPSGLASTTKFLLSSPNKDLQETAFRKEIFRLRIKYVADNLDHICVKIVGKVTGNGHGKSSINLLFNLQNKVVLYMHNIKKFLFWWKYDQSSDFLLFWQEQIQSQYVKLFFIFYHAKGTKLKKPYFAHTSWFKPNNMYCLEHQEFQIDNHNQSWQKSNYGNR